jgi:hypothetical protein
MAPSASDSSSISTGKKLGGVPIALIVATYKTIHIAKPPCKQLDPLRTVNYKGGQIGAHSIGVGRNRLSVTFLQRYMCPAACRILSLGRWLTEGRTLSTPTPILLAAR